MRLLVCKLGAQLQSEFWKITFSLYFLEHWSEMMGRQPRRASGLKALQAIKATSHSNRGRVTKVSCHPPTLWCPGNHGRTVLQRSENEGSKQLAAVSGKGRNALGDVTNQVGTRPALGCLATGRDPVCARSDQAQCWNLHACEISRASFAPDV